MAAELPDIRSVRPDIETPPMTLDEPAAGKRVKQVAPEYKGTGVYHALYLPTDWRKGGRHPVIVEYAGRGEYRSKYGDICTGTVEGSNLGHGITGGKGLIWICMPFVNTQEMRNEIRWRIDVEATVAYCKKTVRRVCQTHGGDPSAVILTGFSRGAIACNYIGLHDDDIASLWLAFITHSNYDGIYEWPCPGSDRASAQKRLERLKGRPVFISQEVSVENIRRYLASTGVKVPFTFQALPYRNHRDDWVLRDIPERKRLRGWLKQVLENRRGATRP